MIRKLIAKNYLCQYYYKIFYYQLQCILFVRLSNNYQVLFVIVANNKYIVL